MAPEDPISVDLSGIINLPAASSETDGLVELATPEETQAGLDDSVAVTPAGAAATYLAIDEFTAKGDLLVGSGGGQFLVEHVGSEGQVLTVCSAMPAGVAWAPLPTPAPSIPCACITGKGAILTGSGAEVPVALPVGTNGQLLMACSACPLGLSWVDRAPSSISASTITGKGVILTGSAPETPTALPAGLNGQILCANPQCETGLEWTSIGKTVSAMADSGKIALTVDNLSVCFTTVAPRTWAFGLKTGCETAVAQTTCAMDTAVATQRRVTTLVSAGFRELGWNFTGVTGCATYLLLLGPVDAPTAMYCFVGMVGRNYCNNMFALTRLY
jgi:hypothetical protein